MPTKVLAASPSVAARRDSWGLALPLWGVGMALLFLLWDRAVLYVLPVALAHVSRPLRPRMLRLPGHAWSEIEWLWVGGLGIACLTAGHAVASSYGLETGDRQYKWSQYLVVGVVVPLVVAIALAVARVWRAAPAVGSICKAILVTVCFVEAGLLLWGQPLLSLAPVALAQFLMLRSLLRQGHDRSTLLTGAAALILGVATLAIAVKLATWGASDPPAFLRSPYTLVAFAAALVLVCVCVRSEYRGGKTARCSYLSPGNLLAILIIALASATKDSLFTGRPEPGPVFHWGPVVGPAEVVRQGGWLLWDVPAQYGFLSTLAVAVLPIGSVWQSFYVANAAFNFLAATFLFFALRSMGAGLWGWWFALVTALGVCLLLSGDPANLFGPVLYPSHGAFRYIWTYALIGILLWELRGGHLPVHRRMSRLAGCVAWLIGALWSVESAFFCSAVWLPGYVVMVGRDLVVRRVPGSVSIVGLRAAVAWLSLPILLLSGAMVAISVFYVVRLGHVPDWLGYLDFARSFGTFPMPRAFDAAGAIWVLFVPLAILGAAVVAAIRGILDRRILPLALGLWGGLWAISSHFIPLTMTPTIMRFAPTISLIFALVPVLIPAGRPGTRGMHVLARWTLVPIMTVIVFMTVSSPGALLRHARSLADGILGPTSIEARLPTADPSLVALLRTAGVKPGDPVVYGGNEYGIMLPKWPSEELGGAADLVVPRTWLPVLPFSPIHESPAERRAIYLARFADRARLSGWLIQRKVDGAVLLPYWGQGPWFFEQVHRSHTPTAIIEDDQWQLIHFEWVGSAGLDRRPQYGHGRSFSVPRDVLVNGRPQRARGTDVWVTYSTGWYEAVPGVGRWASSPAEVFVFSPMAQQVDFQIIPVAYLADGQGGASVYGIMQLVLNSAHSIPVSLRVGELASFTVELDRGWNKLTLALDGGNFRPIDALRGNLDARVLSFAIGGIDLVTALPLADGQ